MEDDRSFMGDSTSFMGDGSSSMEDDSSFMGSMKLIHSWKMSRGESELMHTFMEDHLLHDRYRRSNFCPTSYPIPQFYIPILDTTYAKFHIGKHGDRTPFFIAKRPFTNNPMQPNIIRRCV